MGLPCMPYLYDHINAYIDPQNHPNVGKYGSPMECLGIETSLPNWIHGLRLQVNRANSLVGVAESVSGITSLVVPWA